MTTRPTFARARGAIVGLVLGLLAVIAMHGVSTHLSPLAQLPHASAEPSAHHAGAHDASHGGADAGSHADSHAGAHAGALCALIVAGAALLSPRPAASRRSRQIDRGTPPARPWSPDPPVPRFSFGIN